MYRFKLHVKRCTCVFDCLWIKNCALFVVKLGALFISPGLSIMNNLSPAA